MAKKGITLSKKASDLAESSGASAVVKTLALVASYHDDVVVAEQDRIEAAQTANADRATRSNAIIQLAQTIAALPDAVVYELCSELDNAINTGRRPQSFVREKKVVHGAITGRMKAKRKK